MRMTGPFPGSVEDVIASRGPAQPNGAAARRRVRREDEPPADVGIASVAVLDAREALTAAPRDRRRQCRCRRHVVIRCGFTLTRHALTAPPTTFAEAGLPRRSTSHLGPSRLGGTDPAIEPLVCRYDDDVDGAL
jgi:hypothetical protein